MSQETLDEGGIDYELQLMAGLVPSENLPAEQIPDYVDNLHYLLQRVDVTQLKQENQALIQSMDLFREQTDNKGMLDEQSLMDMLVQERVPTEIQVKYTELFVQYSYEYVSPAKFRYVVSRFLAMKEEQSFVQALNDAYTVTSTGLEVGEGRNKQKLQGYKSARLFLQERLYDIEQKSKTNFIPEGDIRIESGDFLTEMKERREAPDTYVGITSGIAPLDDVTNGSQPGELIFVCGYAEVGKTFFCLNWAHHASTVLGKNVVVATTETPRRQWKRRLYLRHCRNPEFDLPQGIDSDAFKKGQLTPQEEEGVRKAMHDIKNNPNYGLFDVFQVPDGADLAYLHNKLNAINSKWSDRGGIDLFVLDSLNLIIPRGRADHYRINVNTMIKKAKQLAVNFDKGRGIPVVTPWHANRRSWEQATKDGYYTLASWAEADELEKSADLLLWLLKLENSQDTHEILAGIEKYRDGKGHIQFTLYEDFASSYIGIVSAGNRVTGAPNAQPVGQTQQADPALEGLF